MKKAFITTCLLVAISATGFAKNSKTVTDTKTEVKNTSENTLAPPCTYNILIKNVRGQVVRTIPYNGSTPTVRDCCDWAANNVKIWKAQYANSPGYTAESDMDCSI
ncbi:hypothetical protein R1T16_01980 [Flavobacterium sp. DG1-102-2]|uniref:hypothetical protein n=1 Tax=Flavobacterium sp. DG1-102-2 TaxID=3081663 RepID=UPI00294A78E0|nr:hypothetical protein [Flavobacterium sp. DG1-102-2]MDV6167174.1 hypothetical protein [Flavobacterium sp. DG1-102-2]